MKGTNLKFPLIDHDLLIALKILIQSAIKSEGLYTLIEKQFNEFNDWQRRRLERRHGKKTTCLYFCARIVLWNIYEGARGQCMA